MTTTDSILAQHTKWRDALVFHLRMDDVPGDRIGDILLEVESHLAESGETPEDAFGDPKAYAQSRVTDADKEPDGLGIFIIIALSFFGSMSYVSGAMGAGRESTSVYGINPWMLLVIGAALLLITALRLPDDLMRHPRTGKPMLGDLPHAGRLAAALVAAIGVVFFFIGRLLA